MNCQSVRAHLVDQWDQLQGEVQDHDVRHHLDDCGDCRRMAAEMSLGQQWLRDLPQEEPSENFEWRLRLRLNQIEKEGLPLAEESEHSARRWPVSMSFAGSAMAAAMVVLAVGFLSLRAPESGVPGVAPGDGALVENLEAPGAAPTTTPARLQWAADRPGLPELAPSRPDFLKVVPVSAGVPLGPQPQTQPAPSILGEDIVHPVRLPR